jgi:hypothetical protein
MKTQTVNIREPKMHVGGTFSDYHEILLAKLHFLGMQSAAASLLRSYLTERQRKVEIKLSNAAQNFFTN